MTEVTEAVKQARSVGGMGLDYFGMPPCDGSGNAGSKDLYLHMTLYGFPPPCDDEGKAIEPAYSWSSLSAELHMLEMQGLIVVEEKLMPEQGGYGHGVLMEVRWRYTDAGAQAVIAAWNVAHPDDLVASA